MTTHDAGQAAFAAMAASTGPWAARLARLDGDLRASLPQPAHRAASAYLETLRPGLVAGEADTRVSARIRAQVLAWIDRMMGGGDAGIAALNHAAFSALLAIPGAAPRLLWDTADAMWSNASPDPRGGFSFYSKRAILTGVLGSALLYAFGGHDQDSVARFVDRRLADVAKVGRLRRCVAR